jgi:2-dehydro-3-deoxygalactonokinase
MSGRHDTQAALISADWGTTALRIYLLGADGRILDKRVSAQGMASVEKGQFGDVLLGLCAEWLATHGALPAVLSGMVSSRQGWHEVPYVRCPAGLDELAAQMSTLAVAGLRSVDIIAGIDTVAETGIPDVMRGEECQIMGALALMGRREGRFVLPGTHSKWAEVKDGRIVSFRTFMTGEVFAALRDHTILGRMMTARSGTEGPSLGDAFARGIDAARQSPAPGEWLHRLFSVRTLGLMGRLADSDAADYLSGLMIGWELAAVQLRPGERPVLIGSEDLVRRYDRAAELCGISTDTAPTDCVCAGHLRIAQVAGLLPPG